jgi:hypothetical protein
MPKIHNPWSLMHNPLPCQQHDAGQEGTAHCAWPPAVPRISCDVLHQCCSLHTDTAEAHNPPHLVYRPYLGKGVPRLYSCRETSKKEQTADFLVPSAAILNHIYIHFILTIPTCMLFFSISRTAVMFSSVYLTQSFVTDSFHRYTDCQVLCLLFCFVFVCLSAKFSPFLFLISSSHNIN